MKPTRLAPLSTEFQNVQLHDKRLKRRLKLMVDAAEKNPGASLPKQAGSPAELEGTYRFIENDQISPETILDSHVHCTVERCERQPFVFVVHDTTKFKFGGEKPRDGLGRLGSEKSHGFYGHFSIGISPTGEPLGTLGLYAWQRGGKPSGSKKSQSQSQSDPDRESLRWIDSALHTGELLYDKVDAVHVMDREGDSWELLAFLLDANQHFVIRLCHDRRLEPGRCEPQTPKLFESLSNSSFFFERQVALSDRNKRSNNFPRSYSARAGRLAHLEVRAGNHEVFIGNNASKHLPPSLNLNFVEVREINPPGDEEPVIWRLVTTEPIDTEEQVAAIVDAYRTRWVIEELFKALKTGCRYQQHQLESSHSLLILLAIETAIAWRMLLARWLAHNDPEAPGTHILNETQLRLIELLAKQNNRKFPAKPAVKHVLYEIAVLGGHIKNNGPPGWLVLRRGFDELLSIERGWLLSLSVRDR